MPVNVSATLGDLVAADPRRSRVLERWGIDYCCNGHRTLAAASEEAGIALDEIAGALDIPDPPPAPQWQHLEISALAHDIVDTHHAYLWEEMPRMLALVAKVEGVHGDRRPELAEVHRAYRQSVAEIEPHLTKEERVVFPAISRLEKSQTPVQFRFGSLADQLRELLNEHDVVGELFTEIRSLTDGYAVPADACNSYRAMLTGLEEMELDLHEHIHKENNILFPRVIELEQRLAGR
ncbi:iron-sulfur cluster repair di-iron protein [Nostocoides sp. F2B08]|uniref:iron-sulfur cluster repair di-iron protein n=1 Tax=Nostocoides sp. F2B08 TaxID=2653936 RepID=UPI00186B31BE|nr:iron-sulfur cluster repair di-iron protein [Tetrasphaera sp. F2B08]